MKKQKIIWWLCTADREEKCPKIVTSLDMDCPTDCEFRHTNGTANWLDETIEEQREIQGESLFNLIREVE